MGLFDSFRNNDADEEQETAEDLPDQEEEIEAEDAPYTEDDIFPEEEGWHSEYTVPEGGVIDDVARLHKNFIAPRNFDPRKEIVQAGDQWVQSSFINQWPQAARPGFLEPIFSDARFNTDISIHIDPRKDSDAKSDLKNEINNIRTELEEQRKHGSVDARDTKKNLNDAEQMYDLVSRTSMTMFDVSMYINHRASEPEYILENAAELRSLLQQPPASSDPKVDTRRQDQTMLSASPIGKDVRGKKTSMMGGAVGSMIPFTSSVLIEENGVDFGVQPHNGSPVIVDRFDRETGYNMLTIGSIGSGKSFSTKLNLLRTLMRHDDVEVIMMDPLQGFVGLNEALNGDHITVGGDVGLNPLEIRETPEHVLDASEDLDPYTQKLQDVMSFFETFFTMRNSELGEMRGILEKAVQKAYKDADILRDPSTHGRQSPTILDVMNVLQSIAENPSEFTISTAKQERKKRANLASQLLVELQPFNEGGEYENLTRETDIQLNDRVTYLDLQQQEGRGGTGLMMQILFNAVYERAKQSKKNIIFVIDEARYIMKDADNLAFLEQAVRHSRHYDLSIQFITQTADEFFAQEESAAIAANCSLVQLNQIKDLDAGMARDRLGLNEKQTRFVRTAEPGDEERNYSEALLGVRGDGWVPIHIRANDQEKAIVDFDVEEDTREDLPGFGGGASKHQAKEIEKAIETQIQHSSKDEPQTDTTPQNTNATDSSEPESGIGNEPDNGEELRELIATGDFGEADLNELAKNGRQTTVGDGFETVSQPTETEGWEDDELTQEDVNLYHVRLAISNKTNEDEPVITELADAFTIFATDPPELALKTGEYDVGFDAIMASTVGEDQFAQALVGVDSVESVAVTDISHIVDWTDSNASGVSVEELQNAKGDNQHEVQRIFNDLKQQVDVASFAEIQNEEELNDISGDDEMDFDELFGE